MSAGSSAPPPAPERTPSEAAQEQLEAYNAHDLERFVAAYAPDVEVFDLPRQEVGSAARSNLFLLGVNADGNAAAPGEVLLVRGLSAFRERYRAFFTREPRIHCRLLERAAHGAMVMDREELTGRSDGTTVHAIAFYQVERGLIRRVWFARYT